jgi:mRNA interferase RelE/StbE
MELKLERNAAKYFERLDAKTQSRLARAFVDLGKEPPEGDIKKLKGIDGYRLRVGDFRIIFKDRGGIRVIDEITTRGQAYRRKK